MDPDQVTQVFNRCPGCRAIVSPSDASCPSCGRSLANAVEQTMALPRVDSGLAPIGVPPSARPVAPPPPQPGPRVVYAAPPRPVRRRGFPLGLLAVVLLVGVGLLVYLAASRAASMGVGLPSLPELAASGAPAAPAAAPAKTDGAPVQWVVANTGGEGVYLRRTPKLDDRVVAWPDNTPMEDLGEEATGDSLTWRKVRDPRGNVGYVPTQWLARR